MWQFEYAYDWTLKADRYDHGRGQQDEACVGFSKHPLGEPCTIINAADGATYFQFPGSELADDDCCKCEGTYAPFVILPDW